MGNCSSNFRRKRKKTRVQGSKRGSSDDTINRDSDDEEPDSSEKLLCKRDLTSSNKPHIDGMTGGQAGVVIAASEMHGGAGNRHHQYVDTAVRVSGNQNRIDVHIDAAKDLKKPSDVKTSMRRDDKDELQMVLQISSGCDVKFDTLEENVEQLGYTFHGLTADDGNSFFHAIADQLFRVSHKKYNFNELRKDVVEHLSSKRYLPDGKDQFSSVHGYQSWEEYIQELKEDRTTVDHLVVKATGQVLRREIWVVLNFEECGKSECKLYKINIKNCHGEKPLLIAHYNHMHFQSLQEIGCHDVKDRDWKHEELDQGAIAKLEQEPFKQILLTLGQHNICTMYLDQDRFNQSHEAIVNEYKDSQLDRLISKVSSLQNSRGGVLVIYIGKIQHDSLNWFHGWADISLRNLIQDGMMFEKAYQIKLKRKDVCSNVQIIIMTVKGSVIVSTAKFNSAIATNSEITDLTHREMVKYVSGEKVSRRTIPPIIRDIPVHKTVESHTEKTDGIYSLDNLWGNLKLKKYISALSKNENGGSVFYGIHLSEVSLTAMKNEILEKIRKNIGFFTYDGKSEDVNDMCLIEFHHGNNNNPDMVGPVMQVSVRHYDGISHYEKHGPDCFIIREVVEIDPRNHQRRYLLVNNHTQINVEQWIQKLKQDPLAKH